LAEEFGFRSLCKVGHVSWIEAAEKEEDDGEEENVEPLL